MKGRTPATPEGELMLKRVYLESSCKKKTLSFSRKTQLISFSLAVFFSLTWAVGTGTRPVSTVVGRRRAPATENKRRMWPTFSGTTIQTLKLYSPIPVVVLVISVVSVVTAVVVGVPSLPGASATSIAARWQRTLNKPKSSGATSTPSSLFGFKKNAYIWINNRLVT